MDFGIQRSNIKENHTMQINCNTEASADSSMYIVI